MQTQSAADRSTARRSETGRIITAGNSKEQETARCRMPVWSGQPMAAAVFVAGAFHCSSSQHPRNRRHRDGPNSAVRSTVGGQPRRWRDWAGSLVGSPGRGRLQAWQLDWSASPPFAPEHDSARRRGTRMGLQKERALCQCTSHPGVSRSCPVFFSGISSKLLGSPFSALYSSRRHTTFFCT